MAPEPVLALCHRGGSVDEQEEEEGDGQQLDTSALMKKYNIHCKAGWEWNNEDRSKEAAIHGYDNRTGVTFHPNWSNGTAGIRATLPLIGDYNYWEIHVADRVFGTSLMFGLSTKRARLHANEFKHLLGEDSFGWGLSHRGRLHHNGESTYYCKPFQEYTSVVVGILVDKVRGEVTYFKDGVNLGVAFAGLDKVEDDLYPTICSTAAKTAMMVGRRQRSFTDLQDRCRQVITARVVEVNDRREDEKAVVDKLPLPSKVKNYICEALDAFTRNIMC